MKLAALAAAILILPVPAGAQAIQCRAPEVVPAPLPVRPDGPRIAAPITGYTLAISWSPEYCRSAGPQAPDYQCDGLIGRFGFVVHGLWPEARGIAPQWCALEPRPNPAELAAHMCMTPVPWLLAHEWAKHGSCMARTPDAYFKATQALWRSLRLPDANHLSGQAGLTAGDLRRAIAARNPDLPISAIGVLISAEGWLREVRLCYSVRKRPAPCPRHTYGPGDAAALKIRPQP